MISFILFAVPIRRKYAFLPEL